MNRNVRNIRNFILFLALIILTFYILLKDEDITQILDILKSVKIQYVLIGMACMAIYVLCEAINIGRSLKMLHEKSNIIKNIKYALIGFFFSSITPAASGGQPMQIYYMSKEKIPVASSTLALLVNLTSMQIITISVALISLCFCNQYLNNFLIIFFCIGILLNASALALLFVAIFSKKLSNGLISISVKFLKFFRIKNIEGKKEKLEKAVQDYQENAIILKNHKKLMIKVILTTFIQFMFYYSTTYWTYRALGFAEHSIIEIIMMQSVLFATVSGIPSPGAVGVTEGAFTEIFRNIYASSMMSTAVLLNRGINFYLLVLISGIITIINHVKVNIKTKKVETANAEN